MGALSIAFDTIIVGALALAWVALVIHLFFSRDKSGIGHLLDWIKKQDQPAVMGVLIFAMTYFLGSAVSRIAGDLLNDDDLRIQLGNNLYKVVTEDSIRTSVYCGMSDGWFDAIGSQFGERSLAQDCELQHIMRPTWFYLVQSSVVSKKDAADVVRKMTERVQNIFASQESALLLKGQDATERLRQFHDQRSVLRGAAFDAFLAFSLFLFGWCAKFPPKLRWALYLVPVIYLVAAVIAFYNHLKDRALSDPPFMEFTLLVLGVAGCILLWKGAPKETAVQGDRTLPRERRVPANPRGGFLFLLLLFAATAFFGWWTTEVLYDQQVIYSDYARSQK
jgi:hypothetical protein